MADSTGRARSRSAASPPTISASVPSAAFALAPDTGLSSMWMPFFFSSAPSSRVTAGSDELMSMTRVPGAMPGRAAMIALRTALPSGTMVMSTSAPRAASSAERQLPLPFRS